MQKKPAKFECDPASVLIAQLTTVDLIEATFAQLSYESVLRAVPGFSIRCGMETSLSGVLNGTKGRDDRTDEWVIRAAADDCEEPAPCVMEVGAAGFRAQTEREKPDLNPLVGSKRQSAARSLNKTGDFEGEEEPAVPFFITVDPPKIDHQDAMQDQDIEKIRTDKLEEIAFHQHLEKSKRALREQRLREQKENQMKEKKLPKSTRPTHLYEQDSFVRTREAKVSGGT